MDRFIVTESQMLETTLPNLKSNMDRFIGATRGTAHNEN